MTVKELKKFLENCNDELEVEMLSQSHTHIYNDVNKEIETINNEIIVPLRSINIKNNDGYGIVLLTNLED